MDNQEAIEVIKLALSQVEWDYPMDYAVAFDMAISALQALDEIYAFIMKSEASETTDGVLEIFDALQAQEAKHSTESSLTQKRLDTIQAQDVPDTNVGDMISRQAAKLKVARVIWEDGDSCYDFIDKCVDCLDALPSAQPEPCEDAVSRQEVIGFVNSITNLDPKAKGGIVLNVKFMTPVTPK